MMKTATVFKIFDKCHLVFWHSQTMASNTFTTYITHINHTFQWKQWAIWANCGVFFQTAVLWLFGIPYTVLWLMTLLVRISGKLWPFLGGRAKKMSIFWCLGPPLWNPFLDIKCLNGFCYGMVDWYQPNIEVFHLKSDNYLYLHETINVGNILLQKLWFHHNFAIDR